MPHLYFLYPEFPWNTVTMLRGSNVRPDRVKIAIVLLWVVIMANGIEAQELANYR
jgi:hypothetical protein